MNKRLINGSDLINMIYSAAQNVQAHVNEINGLNVFPVPDGDTGTNLSKTINSGLKMLLGHTTTGINQTAEVFAKGLLMGARGNSGVILSQFFRGIAASLAELEEADASQFAAALKQGAEMAYDAVLNPVEGTILTVSRRSAEAALQLSQSMMDVTELMEGVLRHAERALAETPEQLPVLKKAGVVDSGGQGLVYIFEGFYAALQQDAVAMPIKSLHHESPAQLQQPAEIAQAQFSANDIIYPYDMEFLIHIDPFKGTGKPFDAESFRQVLAQNGDSVLVIHNEDVVKVHVHTNAPGQVLNSAIYYGELSQFHIENMREQHDRLLTETNGTSPSISDHNEAEESEPTLKRFGFVAIAAGEGISDIFYSIGVDYVLFGGQTMNPSTEHIVDALRQVHAETIFLLPNNANIILAANQAKEFVDAEVIVIPTTSYPQGFAAMFAFQEQQDTEANTQALKQALQMVKSGQLTTAVRNAEMDGLSIQKGQFIGVFDGTIVAGEEQLQDACKRLLQRMIAEDDEIISIYSGEEASDQHTEEMLAYLQERYPEMEIEHHYGGQPLYAYIFSVE